MDIYAKSGTKVKFTANGGYSTEIESAKKIMTIGNLYTVESIDVGGFHTTVYLKEFPSRGFNSCLFEDLEQEGD